MDRLRILCLSALLLVVAVPGAWAARFAPDSTSTGWLTTDLGPLAGGWAGISEHGAVIWQGADGVGRIWQFGAARKLGTLGGRYSVPTDVNERGQVVGWSATSTTAGITRWHAFLWEKGRMRDLGTLGGRASYATAINDQGEIVGWAETDRHEHPADTMFMPGDAHRWSMHSGTRHAFIWSHGKMRDLGTLGGAESYAAALNANGTVVGQGHLRVGDKHGFVWHAGLLQDVGDLGGGYSNALAVNASDEVVGESWDPSNYIVTYLWQNGQINSLGINDIPDAINNHGQVIAGLGSFWDGSRIITLRFIPLDLNDRAQIIGEGTGRWTRPILWQNGTTTDLGTLPGAKEAAATAINNLGQIAGWSTSRDGRRHAVRWTPRR